jgi:hypothetical protein
MISWVCWPNICAGCLVYQVFGEGDEIAELSDPAKEHLVILSSIANLRP